MTERDERPGSEDVGIMRRKVSPDPESAEYELLEIIAELEDSEMDELPSLYGQVDHFIETLFKHPPSVDAHLVISFSYAGYRITIDQSGVVDLVRVAEAT